MNEEILKNLATYSAIKEVDKMTDEQKIEFSRKFQQDLQNDPELREMYDEFVTQPLGTVKILFEGK